MRAKTEKIRENRAGGLPGAQLRGFLYHMEGHLVRREENSLNQTLSQNFCVRSPGGRDPFGNGLFLHAVLRL